MKIVVVLSEFRVYLNSFFKSKMNQPRHATKNDMPRVLELINELAIFEKEPDAVAITLADLENDGFGTNPKFTCFVVEMNDSIEGIALVYPRYSTWKGEVLHLEDLIVSQKNAEEWDWERNF